MRLAGYDRAGPTRFFLGPGRYTLPRSLMLLGKKAAGPSPAKALAKSSMSSDCERPATTLHTTSQQTPRINMIFPPYISDSLPKGRRKQDTTRENTDAGHVDDDSGIPSAPVTDGTRTLKPEKKYSLGNMRVSINESKRNLAVGPWSWVYV